MLFRINYSLNFLSGYCHSWEQLLLRESIWSLSSRPFFKIVCHFIWRMKNTIKSIAEKIEETWLSFAQSRSSVFNLSYGFNLYVNVTIVILYQMLWIYFILVNSHYKYSSAYKFCQPNLLREEIRQKRSTVRILQKGFRSLKVILLEDKLEQSILS